LSPQQKRQLWLAAGWRALAGLALLAYLAFTIAVSLPAAIRQAGPGAPGGEYVLILAFLIVRIGYLSLAAVPAPPPAAGGHGACQTGGSEVAGAARALGGVSLTIQGQQFAVPSKVWNALVPGRAYACYTAPHTRQVLAIEPSLAA